MLSFFEKLFDTADFPLRWQCGNWSDGHSWLHILADSAIFGAYFAIPLILTSFVLRRKDVPFPPIFWLFAAFILSCGIGHLVEASLFWNPWYRLSGLVKVVTATVSWATVVALIPLLPKALALPGLALVNEQLKQKEERVRLIVESSLDAVVTIDDCGRIIAWNTSAEMMFGLRRDEVIGCMMADLVIPERFREAHHRGLNHFLATGEGPILNKRLELFALRKRCEEFPVELTIAPIRTGERYEFNAFVRDISERKQREEQLRQTADDLRRSNQELEVFAYSTSHDLKAPLRAVDHLAQWIADDAGHLLPETSRRDLDLMRQRLARMQRLLDDLLAYSRVGRIKHEVEVVDTANLVRAQVELLGLSADFTVTVGALPVLRTCKPPLEQVFRNLISNAVKHHDRSEGKVEVSATDRGTFVEFVVRDDGPGIAPEFHERIFQMFQTLKPRDQIEGSGMGLALVKKIVEGQGGSIELKSTPGSGTAFLFTWPRG